MSKRRGLLWLAVGLGIGYAYWRMPEMPVVIWGNEHYVLIRTTPDQSHRVLELATEYCGRVPDPTNPRRGKFAMPADVPVEATRTPGVVRFDCVRNGS